MSSVAIAPAVPEAMTHSILVQYALWAYRWGAIPVRVGANSKIATDPGWQHTTYTGDAEVVARFTGHTGNLGLTLPPTLVALDQDVKNGQDGRASLLQLAATAGVTLPLTLTAKTPSGGSHSVFRLPAGATLRNAVGVAPGLDVRTAGGYIVAAPSIVNGQPYTWETGGAGIAELPRALVDLLNAPRLGVLQTAGEIRRIPSGARNAELTSMGGGMRQHGFAQAAIEAALQVANADQCDTPLDDDEVTKIAHSVSRYAPAPIAREVFAGSAPLPPGASLAPIGPGRFPHVSLADLHTKPEADQLFLIGDILPAGVLTLLSGHGGTGKTTLAQQAAICLATDLLFLGLEVTRCRVLFYSGEDPAPVVRRALARLCRHYSVDPTTLDPWLRVLDATSAPVLFNGLPTDAFRALEAEVAEFAPMVVVIDNASDAFDGNEIERARVREFVRLLVTLGAANGAAVLLLGHVDKATVKTGGSGGEGYSGSTAWNNSARSRLFLTVEGTVVTLTHQKSNLGRLADPLYLMRGPGGVLIEGQAPGGEDDRAAVLSLITEHCTRGVTISPHIQARNNAWAVLRVDGNFPAGLKKDAFARILASLFSSDSIFVDTYRTPDRKEKARISVRSTVEVAP